jgi:hypothetical protein
LRTCVHADTHARDLVLVDDAEQVHLRGIGDCHQHGAAGHRGHRRDGRARVEIALQHHAVNRCGDGCVCQFLLEPLERRACPLQAGVGSGVVGAHPIEDLLRFDAALKELFLALQLDGCVVAFYLCFMDDGAGFAHGRFQGLAIDFRDDLSRRDPISRINRETLDDTAHFGAHLDEVFRLDGT